MADVPSLRAEIKAWERSFKDENGAPPTVEDIKQNPPIAEKYKQYKKLSKAAASSSSNSTQQTMSTPSTPPRTTRPTQPPSALLSRTRVVQSTAPLASFNPFSPQKKQKGKERETESLTTTSKEAHYVPSTSKLPGETRQRQLFSPEPNSSTVLSTSSLTMPLAFQFNPHAEAANAVSRARKRLRGEPVSPSPNKDKRRRVLSQTTLPFPRLNLDAQSSDEDEEPHEGDSSFVDNSPVKSTSAGKLFPALFEETLVPMDLFGVKSNLGLSNYNSSSQPHKVSSVEHSKTSKRVPSSKGLPILARDSGEPDLTFDKTDPNHIRKLDVETGQDNQADCDTSRASVKRSHPEDEDDTTNRSKSSRARSPLLPPSPPPSTNTASYNEAGKKKARAKNMMNKSRKKAKKDEAMSPGPESDEEEESLTKLRVVRRNTMRQHHATSEDDEGISDLDAVLGYTRFTGPRGMSPAETRQEDGEGTADVDLPDKLRNVLALETTTLKAQTSQEDSLVQGLLYGRRVTHYNPQKGGEIWDVGEDAHNDAEAGRYTEGEDDWEGEPVPWEAAEL